MALRIGTVGTAFATALAGIGLLDVRTAQADEAFLCGPDTVVYVKPAELELKKRTDPCIAAYFGLKVEAKVPADPADSGAAPGGPKTPALKGSSDKAHMVAPAPSAPIELKRLPEPERERSTRAAEERSASLTLPLPAPGTDYRNVRVINAASPQDEWYRHVR